MFKWLTRWAIRRQRKRYFFTFLDGDRERVQDPIVAFRSLNDDPEFNIDIHPQLVDANDSESLTIMLNAICRAFNVHRWDETKKTGMTEYELLGLFDHFAAYIDRVKKNIRLSPISPSPTASTSPESKGKSPNGSRPSTSTKRDQRSASPTEPASRSTTP